MANRVIPYGAVMKPQEGANIEDQVLEDILLRGNPQDIWHYLKSYPPGTHLNVRSCKMAAKRLTSHLDTLDLSDIQSLLRLFVDSNCTAPDFLEKLHAVIQKLMGTMSADQMVELLAICEKLEEYKAQSPPNQLLVKFLQDLQEAAYSFIQQDDRLLQSLREGLKKKEYPLSSSEGILNALLLLGKLKPKQYPFYQAQIEAITAKTIPGRKLPPAFLTNVALFLSRSIKEKRNGQLTKKNFYTEDSHRTLAARLQCEVNSLSMEERSHIVAGLARARIRDQSLLRTFARKFSPSNMQDLPLIVKNLESYAELSYPNQNIFEIAYKMFVQSGMQCPAENALETLYATVVWGANPGTLPIKKIKQLYLSISPYVNAGCCHDWMRYELIDRFSQIMFPNPVLPPLPAGGRPSSKTQAAGTVSPSQQAIVDFLRAEGEVVECEVFIPVYPYPLDIVLPQRRLVIELDGPHHYDVGGEKRLGKEFLKDFILQNSDWNIEHVKWQRKQLDLTSLLLKVKSYPIRNQ